MGKQRRGAHAEERRIEHKIRNIAIPAFLAALSMLIVAYTLHYMNFDIAHGNGSGALIFASVGSSAFVLFMTPRAKAAHISKFTKSYIGAGIVGYAGFLIKPLIGIYVAIAFVVFMATIVLIMTRAEHPPAVGIAVAFVLYNVGFYGILVVVLSAALLIFLRIALEKAVFVIEHDVDNLIERL